MMSAPGSQAPDPQSPDPRYPVGKFAPVATISPADRSAAIQTIAQLPKLLREAVEDFSDEQLNTPYRDGGWTVRQVVHHLADSHMTAFHRMRRALTEDWPVIHGYNEKAFAVLPDGIAPVEWSLDVIDGLHARWTMMLGTLTEEQWKRGMKHMERGPSTLEATTMLYAWHSRHHVAHITEVRARQGW